MNSYLLTIAVANKITSDPVACIDGFLLDKVMDYVPIQVYAWNETQKWLRATDAKYLIVQGSLSTVNRELVISATGAWPTSNVDPERLISQANLVGRAGQDPKARFFDSGSSLAEWTLATTNPPRRGESKPAPDWHNIKAWGITAEIAADYVRRGSLISVSGRLEIEKWTDRTTGENRWKAVVNCKRLELLGSKSNAAGAEAASAAPARHSAPSGGW